MCGIAGIIDSENSQIAKGQLDAMISQISHRGPDNQQTKLFPHVGLAHARLSIIDLVRGDQPIANEDETIWVILNGEIYNYIELRADLVNRGHTFRTRTDTEVIVHLYEEYGERFINQLNGQFAIALYDSSKKVVFLVRDRIGIVPLFYTNHGSRLCFASEIKSILTTFKNAPEANLNALDQLFTFWAPVSPNTVFKNVFELPPGYVLCFDLRNTENNVAQ